jgi:predicted P-loop ATPase
MISDGAVESMVESNLQLIRGEAKPARVAVQPADSWRARLITTDAGNPRPVLENAIVALRHAPEWRGVLAFDDFAQRIVTRKAAPWGVPAPIIWADREDYLATGWLNREGILVSALITYQAVKTVAGDQHFHPVREYLGKLVWDRTHRLNQWFHVYLGAEHNDLISAFGAKFLISAVARIYRPGCKADCAPVFEGRQGKYKSMMLGVLAGDWFTDDIAELGSKDAAMQVLGKWIIEIAELDAMRRSEVNRVKSFLSRATDRFRPPYGKHVIEAPRQCIFAGTVNQDAWNPDETGGRRFWPVRCTDIKIEELTRDRDQLWAEARNRYRLGEHWWLDTPELNSQAEEEQIDRYETDAWDALIIPWARNRFSTGSNSVSIGEALELCLGISRDKWTKPDQMRVGRSFKAAGWERYRDRQRDFEWRYRIPVPTSSGNTGEGGNVASS